MDPSSDQPVTQLLAAWRDGNREALSQLTALVYDELRRLAQRHLRRERSDHTIQRTALVHEAFVRLINQQSVDWRNRSHFFALASRLMRRILVDHARARTASKRGGGAAVLSLDELAASGEADEPHALIDGESPAPQAGILEDETRDDIAAIDEALTRLEALDKRQAQIVEMRYFGGMTIEETAEVMELSEATIKREWTLARAWLRRALTQPP